MNTAPENMSTWRERDEETVRLVHGYVYTSIKHTGVLAIPQIQSILKKMS
jgi:hypothetical protein